MVLVPQSLSYAVLANLPSEYGLYASFIGVLTYAFFATSKDVSIGPVAVMSLQTGIVVNSVVDKLGDKYTKPQIAVCLAFICGFIVLAIGLLRVGWIVEFIPQPAVSGFMTGSAINIAAGQVPAMLGLSKRLNTRAPTYEVIINTLKNLPNCS
jgi:sodium-independent sulfate anion transporter 11